LKRRDDENKIGMNITILFTSTEEKAEQMMIKANFVVSYLSPAFDLHPFHLYSAFSYFHPIIFKAFLLLTTSHFDFLNLLENIKLRSLTLEPPRAKVDTAAVVRNIESL
jgi:hypothetical protein